MNNEIFEVKVKGYRAAGFFHVLGTDHDDVLRIIESWRSTEWYRHHHPPGKQEFKIKRLGYKRSHMREDGWYGWSSQLDPTDFNRCYSKKELTPGYVATIDIEMIDDEGRRSKKSARFFTLDEARNWAEGFGTAASVCQVELIGHGAIAAYRRYPGSSHWHESEPIEAQESSMT